MVRGKAKSTAKAKGGKGRPAPLSERDQALVTRAAHALQVGDVGAAARMLAGLSHIALTHSSVAFLTGQLHLASGRAGDALIYLRKATELSPRNAMFQLALGDALAGLERFDEAASVLRLAIRADGKLTDAYGALGLVLYKAGQYKEADKAFSEVIRRAPDVARHRLNAAANAIERGELNAAGRLLEQAELLASREPKVRADLAGMYLRLQRAEDALRVYDAVLLESPDDLAALEGRAQARAAVHRFSESVADFQRAGTLRGEPDRAARLIARAAGVNGLIKEALGYYAMALELEPDDFRLRSEQLLYHNYSELVSPEDLYREHAKLQAFRPRAEAPRFDHLRRQAGKLRVGYVSADFRRHSVAYFIEPVLRQHDRKRFEVHCYYNGKSLDETSRRLRHCVAGWRHIAGMDDAEAVEAIRADNIDILVDLSGHTEGNRLPVFVERAAPVQITWLGYPNTTGVVNMDYRITDGIADPPGTTDALNTERLIRLPRVFSCYQPPEQAPSVGDPPVCRHGYVTFGSFNNYNKLNDALLAWWAQILAAVPRSRLLLKAKAFGHAAARERVAAVFANRGIAPERLDMVAWETDKHSHLARYGDVDIALDSFPYCGTTTTCEALWMGVPVVTLAGADHRSRVGASQLSALHLEDLVAESPVEYVSIATRLASDQSQLVVLRSGMRESLRTSPLMDYSGFVAELEAAYIHAWHAWCDQKGD